MADTEEYFPRGGKKPTLTHFKQNANFLGAPEKAEKKKRKPKKKSEGDDGYLSDDDTKEVDQATKNCAHGISKKVLKEGVLLLGRVKQITDTRLEVSLPGRMWCFVMACHVSEAYNKLLEAYVNDQSDKVSELKKLFRVGQYIVVSVLEAKDTIMVSTMPQHVNAGKTHTDLHKGLIIQAAVSSVEDHGFLMDIGIPNTRAFLPSKHANPEINLEVGMVTWCVVRSVDASPAQSVVTLSSELSALQDSWLRYKPTGSIIPGNAVDFQVDTPLENGIEGHIFNDTLAYVQRQHVDKVKGKKPKLGQRVRARILYVMPTRNTPFLTMKNIFNSTYPDLAEEQTLKTGDIIEEAQVLKIVFRTIMFRLQDGCVGHMSKTRVQVHEDLNDEDIIAKSYPIGSKHRVRVLMYHLSDGTYAVSDQPEILREKYFTPDQLQVGQLVDATIRSVAENHVLLTVGRLIGYVQQIHLSESGIYTDPKKSSNSKLPKIKYKVGQPVKARVLMKDPNKENAVYTLKPSLLVPDLVVLQSYEQAEIGKAYTGVILRILRNSLMVSFFNYVTAIVLKRHISREPLENIGEAFHIGQIVKCTIMNVDVEAKKMLGSLITAPFTPTKNPEKLGKRQLNDDEDAQKVPRKKNKTSDDNDTEPADENEPKSKKKNKKNKQKESRDTAEATNEEVSVKKSKKKKKAEVAEETPVEGSKKNKKKKPKQEQVVSEDSDAMETEDTKTQYTIKDLEVGQIVDATVHIITANHILLNVGLVTGCVPQIHVPDSKTSPEDSSKPLKKKFKVGQKVKARVLWVDLNINSLYLTLKPALLTPELEVIQNVDQLEVGKAYTGVITLVRHYVLVTFFNRVAVYVSKSFVTKAKPGSERPSNLEEVVHLGQVVNCTILRIDKQKNKIAGSLVTEPFTPNPRRDHLEDSEDAGSDKKKTVDSGELFAAFNKREKDNKTVEDVSEDSDAIETDVYEDSDQPLPPQDLQLMDFSECERECEYKRKLKSLGKNVTNRIRRALRLEQKISRLEARGLNENNKRFYKAMHIEKAVVEKRAGKLMQAMEIANAKIMEFRLERKDQKTGKKEKKSKKISDEDTQNEKVEKKVKEKVKKDKAVKERDVNLDVIKVVESLEPALEAPSAKDFWSTNNDNVSNTVVEDSSSSDEEEQEQPKKKRKKLTVAEKVAKAREEEERVREMERRAIESEAQPRSSDQFERALLASPNCSQLWIAYMAFHLQATEIEKARAVGRKALNTISFREEEEKLNVWLAMINFENRFGTKESQQKTLEEALQTNEPYKVHSKLLDIYVETGKHQELVSLVDLMIRKYKRDPAAYIACGTACFKLGLVDKARQVMQKAIAVLEKKEHVSVLVQFALLERSNGGLERAEALFEQVLAVYPQRVDVASTYVDMLVKSSNIDHIRQVMERMTSQKLPARKMKTLYNKWVEVEEKIGDAENVEKIKQRAMEYIEKAKF